MISARQLKAARALLGISQAELAERAGVGVATVRRLETAEEVRGQVATLTKLQVALTDEGVIFIARDEVLGEGVRLRF
ncbi:MAG: helix-turn-helix domain-containing protein [Hyphomicrobiaceae bacterium]